MKVNHNSSFPFSVDCFLSFFLSFFSICSSFHSRFVLVPEIRKTETINQEPYYLKRHLFYTKIHNYHSVDGGLLFSHSLVKLSRGTTKPFLYRKQTNKPNKKMEERLEYFLPTIDTSPQNRTHKFPENENRNHSERILSLENGELQIACDSLAFHSGRF